MKGAGFLPPRKWWAEEKGKAMATEAATPGAGHQGAAGAGSALPLPPCFPVPRTRTSPLTPQVALGSQVEMAKYVNQAPPPSLLCVCV